MPSLEPGSVLADRFEVVGVLGRGGMATVVLARDRLRGERVALKVLHPHLATDVAMRGRLRREVLAAGRLRHPHALVAHELYELDDTLALSMPLHQGQTLTDWVSTQGPLTGDALRRLGRQVSSALAEAHRLGIVHRDVTPSNIMVDDQGDACLSDFGLARLEDHRTATASGVMGTTGYVAPEVFDGVRADPRSDVYSLGAVLYTAATGTGPFAAPTPMGVLQRQLDGDHLPLAEARPDLPEDLVQTIEAMLRVDRDARVQGAGEVVRALESGHAPAPAPEPVPVSAPEPPVTSLTRAQLPTGEFTVVVKESHEQRRRRDRLRRRLRKGAGAHDPAGEIIEEVRKGVLSGIEGIDHSEWGDRVADVVDEVQGWGEGTPLGPPAWGRHPGRRGRRGRRRRGRLRGQRSPAAQGINAAFDGIKRGVTSLLTPSEGPERALASAVAREAAIPTEALKVSPDVYKRRFRLVGKVDRATALRLATSAREQGFRAEVAEARRKTEGALRRTWRVFGAVLGMLVAMALFMGITQYGGTALLFLASQGIDLAFLQPLPDLLASLGRWPYIAIFLLYFMPLLGRRQRKADWERLPVAYGEHLDAHLTEGFRLAGQQPTRVEVEESPPPEATPRVEPVVEPQGPLGSLLTRTREQLDAFDRAVVDASEELADFAVAELRQTVAELRSRSESLATEAQTLEADLARARATEDLAAASGVQSRLERLITLQAAGESVSTSEIEQLQRSLAAHQQALEATEHLEGRLTILYARLLEIGSSATQARRELLQEAQPTTATRLLDELRREAGAASEALGETRGRLPREPVGEQASAGTPITPGQRQRAES